jgi:hypothetical protein
MQRWGMVALLGLCALCLGTQAAFAQTETFQTTSNGKTITCGASGSSWIPGSLSGSKFTSLVTQRTKKRTALKKATGAKLAQLKKAIKTLTTRIKTEGPVCALGPPDDGDDEVPADGDYFDSSGNLTADGKLAFGVPSELSGNVTSGRVLHDNNSCKSCHTEKTNSSYSLVLESLEEPSMTYLADSLSTADLANLVAYLNRFRLR